MSDTRFDDWTDVVDCNQCTHYWDDSCTGILEKGTQKRCTSYVAKRDVVIPKQIKRIETILKWYCGALSILFISIVTLIIKVWFGI